MVPKSKFARCTRRQISAKRLLPSLESRKNACPRKWPRTQIPRRIHPHNLNSYLIIMCRNIKTLHNFAPPATEEEIRASSLQFVRKLSGFTKPSQANEDAFNRAVDQVTLVAQNLLNSFVTNAP